MKRVIIFYKHLNVKEKNYIQFTMSIRKKMYWKDGTIIKNKVCDSINSKMSNIENNIPIPNGLILDNVYVRYD